MVNIPSVDEMLAIARQSFAAYCVMTDPNYQLATHIDMVCKLLEKVASHEWTRAQVWMPPRHSKTETCTRKFVAWYLGNNPTHQVLLGCHTKDLASNFGNDIRNNLLNPIHVKIFPDDKCRLSGSSKAKDEFVLNGGGKFYAGGVGTAVAGRGADLIIIDDPIKDWEAAQSKVQREGVHNWYAGNIYTRQQPNACIMIINTRWHEADLSGWLLDPHKEQGVEDWKILKLSAIAERDEGWRAEGDCLWPERFDQDHLAKIKKAIGSYNWQSQYQQSPSAIEGIEIKRSWFKWYAWNPHMAANRETLKGIITQPFMIVQSWDTALEPGEENDYSVCGTWLWTPSGEYLLDVWRKKVIAPDLFQAAKELAIYWGANAVLVEKKSSGHSLIQMMPSLVPGLPVIPCTPRGDKQTRMRTSSPIIEGGTMFLPYSAPWLGDYTNELVAFPTGSHDDQVDMTSQYLNWQQMRREQQKDSDLHEEPQGYINVMDL